MSLFDALLLGALRSALEEAGEDQDGSTTTTVSRTDRYVFHGKHGNRVSLSGDRKTAARQSALACFDEGIVFSDQPLQDNEIFEVRIDQMIPTWNGSIEIGVTSINPVNITLPKTMTDMVTGTWMLSGSQVTSNGSIIKRGYGENLTSLSIGHRVGVTRTDNGTLHFFINGKHQGIAARGIPQGVYAVVDIYGTCTKVSISTPPGVPSSRQPSLPAPVVRGVPVPSSDNELQRYMKQRQWIQDCRRVPFALWLLKELSSASSTDDKKEIFLFVNSFGHRLNQDTATCDGCNRKVPIRSHRFRCMQCEDLDLCDTCFNNEKTPNEHQLNHKVAEMRYCCDGNDCGGHITGTRFHCMVCHNFDLCLGCKTTSNWPARHSTNHTMTKSSTIMTLQETGSSNGVRGTSVTDGACQHNFAVGQCQICKSCGKCTGYADNCVENRKPNRNPGGLCGCGYGDSGCLKCKICKHCAAKGRVVPNASRTVDPRPATAVSKKCEYREKCVRFVDSLKIPDAYFDKTPAYNKCFCEDCHKARGDRECYTRGKPSKTYGLPIGWSRFAIKAPAQAKVLKAFDEWHVAFHGTKASCVEGILNSGTLLMAGDVALGGSELGEGKGHYNENWKPPGFDTKKIFVSPSIKYAGCPVYSKKESFTDPTSKTTLSVQVALQVIIRPGCYEIGKTTVERTQPFDSNFNDSELEWSTKERGAIFVTGLLVKMQ